MPNSNSYIQQLLITNPVRESILRRAIAELQLPKGSKGLDVGCGIGLQTLLMAETIGKNSNIVGLDISPEFLKYGDKVVRKTNFDKQITFKQGSIYDLPFERDTFDWLWSADCAGYPESNPERLMNELTRVVKPGGTIAILIYSDQQLLPGYPFLEARLNATATGIAPFRIEMKPETHYFRALGWFKKADLQEPLVKTLTSDFYAPLENEIKEGLLALIKMRWDGAQTEVSKEDWDLFTRLSNPKSSDFILNLSDYFGYFTYSLFFGKVQ